MLAVALAVAAAQPRCYLDSVWSNSSLRVLSNIPYGSSFNNKTGTQQQLLLDAYLPPASDTRTKIPVLVFVHGGGFVGGDKTGEGDVRFVKELVQRGFAAISVDYRLTGEYWTWESQRPVLDAVEDVRAAIRYVRSVAAEQRLDTTRILLAGESAGAVTSLYIGYADMAQYDGGSGNPGWSSAVSTVMPISGELKQQAYCDTVVPAPQGCKIDTGIDITDDVKGSAANFPQPPLLMLHGTADLTVPYVDGKAVYDRAQAVGLNSTLITMKGATHVPWDVIFTDEVFSKTTRAIADALDLANAQQPAGCTPSLPLATGSVEEAAM